MGALRNYHNYQETFSLLVMLVSEEFLKLQKKGEAQNISMICQPGEMPRSRKLIGLNKLIS